MEETSFVNQTNSTNENVPFVEEEKPKRSTLLVVLSILTMIAVFFTILSIIFAYFADSFLGSLTKLMEENGQDTAQMETTMEQLKTSRWMLPFNFIFTLVNLIGVIMMLKLNKKGFYVYAGIQLISLFWNIFVGTSGVFGIIFSIIFTGLFIYLYYIAMKQSNVIK